MSRQSVLAVGLLVAVLITLAAGTAFRAINTATDPSTQLTQLYAITSDGSGFDRLAADDQHHYWGPAWSPDGRLLAYTIVPADGPGQLFVANADGTSPTQITHDEYGGYLAVWSPDARDASPSSDSSGPIPPPPDCL